MVSRAIHLSAVRVVKPEHARVAVAHLRRVEPRFVGVVRQVGRCGYRAGKESPFEALVRTIVDQQLSVKAGATICGRVVGLFDCEEFPTPERVLAMPEARMLGAGLSRNKLAAIRDLAAKTLDGTVPTRRAMARLSDEELIERLTAVRGIGRWTAELLLLHLGRPDVFPVGDLVLRKRAGLLLGLQVPPTERELLALGEPWRPWRSVASWYLWRWRPSDPLSPPGRGLG